MFKLYMHALMAWSKDKENSHRWDLAMTLTVSKMKQIFFYHPEPNCLIFFSHLFLVNVTPRQTCHVARHECGRSWRWIYCTKPQLRNHFNFISTTGWGGVEEECVLYLFTTLLLKTFLGIAYLRYFACLIKKIQLNFDHRSFVHCNPPKRVVCVHN